MIYVHCGKLTRSYTVKFSFSALCIETLNNYLYLFALPTCSTLYRTGRARIAVIIAAKIV